MRLRDVLGTDAINLNLQGTSRDAILRELVRLLHLDSAGDGFVLKMLKRRERSGSTGVGRSFAIPHCRFPGVQELRVAYGRRLQGVDFAAMDQQPVQHFFLIVAPPVEVANQYLPVLGRIAEIARKPGAAERLAAAGSPTEFLEAIDELEAS
jgi:mannitol/fructose-specific phosphotransferase system IIA component (Ntr-type)